MSDNPHPFDSKPTLAPPPGASSPPSPPLETRASALPMVAPVEPPATRQGTSLTGDLALCQVPHRSPLLDIPGYEVLEEIGRGGMGVVYKARQIKANRIVALKMILASRHASLEEKVRFQIEAEAVAQLLHPNIVQLHDAGEHDGLPFFSLEYCGGGSLDGKLKQWTPTPVEAADLIETLARAMHFAHLRGVVHRDLKPANVLLTAEGQAKITDFGLAKRMNSGSDLSQSGEVMGTPNYMAPEQAAGKVRDTGPAADVCALGAMFYELLCGRPPFHGQTVAETIMQVMTEEPLAPSQRRAGVPRDLETICLKCLQKEPGRRYASAEDLADDLRHWRDGEPIAARPVGGTERLVKWIKRKPALAGLVAVVLAAFGLVGWQLSETRSALERVREEQTQREKADRKREQAETDRALARVDSLRKAAPGAVAEILRELERSREDVLPRLRERWQEGGTSRERMRVGLALLPVEPEKVRADLVEAMLAEDEPEEMLLLRDALGEQGSHAREQLWKLALNMKREPKKGFKAVIGLAVFDPADRRWETAAPAAVEQMLGENKLHLRTWMLALHPVRAALLKPLSKEYGDPKASPERREFAATVLANFAQDNPNELAKLLLDADPKQYAVLFPVLDRYRAQAVERMRREVKGDGYWNDAPLDSNWTTPAAEPVREIEAAEGMMHERWALCQSLPLDRWEAVSEGLRKSGYRPVRLRPWAGAASRAAPGVRLGSPDLLRTAAIWTRDGREWKSATDLTAKGLAERDAAHQKSGFIPADVSAYDTEPACRFAAVWVKPWSGETARLYANLAIDKHAVTVEVCKKDGFVPLTVQACLGGDGKLRFCSVWLKAESAPKQWWMSWDNSEDAHKGRVLLAEQLLVDVNISSTAPGFLWLPSAAFASVLHGDANREAAASHGLSVGAHRERCRELADQGYRPAALSVGVLAEGKTATASLWHRPFPKQEVREKLARRQATGAVTLLKMDAPADAWPLLRHRPDPEARSQFIWRSGLLAVNPKMIAERLNEEKDVSARRALILSLGEFTGEQLPASLRGPLTEKLLGWYKDDPDPGIHGAVDWLLRHDKEGDVDRPLKWGQAARLKKIDEELQRRDPDDKRRWHVNNQGQTMVLVPGPVEFRMGSPPLETGRFEGARPHRRRIPRSFAIGSRFVTVAEFELFLKDRPDVKHNYTKRYSPEPDGPIITVTWFMAAQYCNWLSEQEKIPETEWCYPKHDDIKADMTPYPDYLKRKGYRLPTEAEWEYAARAEAVTSRYYGSSVELLPRYAWYLENSKPNSGGDNRAWPAGQKRPNDLGLLDIQGNVWNWVYDPGYILPQQQGITAIFDKEDVRYIKESVSRVLRGGSFSNQASYVRSSIRSDNRPSIRNGSYGLRVSRTYH